MRWLLMIALVLGFALASPARALASPPPYYPQIDWYPASPNNYDVGRTMPITQIVIHETDGPWYSAVNWFQNPRSQVSAHYLVRAWDGDVLQFVAEADTAFHARPANAWTIGIEHEFDPYHGIYHTDVQYRASATLVCAIARRYGIPIDRQHIVGHREIPGADHSDPGPSWNWSYYMSLVRGCSGGSTLGQLNLLAGKSVPVGGLEVGTVSANVALLQWDLTYLGFMSPDDVSQGGGTFGPITLDAVTKFQDSRGVPTTGYYGDLTAAALADSLVGDVAALPAGPLQAGAESEDVATVQQALQRLGYMDTVTGYYGPITTDAVAQFQTDNGLDPTGAYDALTRVALATRLP
jgi:N-acetyl-anhydromuramyl-L-alanine amidase AmpD